MTNAFFSSEFSISLWMQNYRCAPRDIFLNSSFKLHFSENVVLPKLFQGDIWFPTIFRKIKPTMSCISDLKFSVFLDVLRGDDECAQEVSGAADALLRVRGVGGGVQGVSASGAGRPRGPHYHHHRGQGGTGQVRHTGTPRLIRTGIIRIPGKNPSPVETSSQHPQWYSAHLIWNLLNLKEFYLVSFICLN